MKFSQRIGKTKVKVELQIENIDDDLKNRLWNVFYDDFYNILRDNKKDEILNFIFEIIWKDFFKNKIDEMPEMKVYNHLALKYYYSFIKIISYIKNWFFSVEWYEIYDFIEFLSKFDDKQLHLALIEKCNEALREELSGYRLIKGKIVQITAEEEILEIEEAIDNTDNFNSVNTHLKTALKLISDRKEPDYRNSIKESISAVEAICKILTKNENATLGDALKEIDKKFNIHKELINTITKLYAFTNACGGIRHAEKESNVNQYSSFQLKFEEAKFILVMSSALVNYLKSKM